MKVQQIEFHVLPMATRFPFKYGIASMTHLPHLFVTSTLELDGRTVKGLATEGLPPKWFTKIPDTPFEQDLKSDLKVIRSAAATATAVGNCDNFFSFWQQLYTEHRKNWFSDGVPSLLANFALSLVERSCLDGLARHTGSPVHELIRSNRIGLDAGSIHSQLEGIQPSDFIPARPLDKIIIRHTVGLGDPLTPEDITPEQQLDDGLPFDLVSNIKTYGLTYFKIKLCGNSEIDLPRLKRIAEILRENTRGDYYVTLDGNEQFSNLSTFREAWEALDRIPIIHDLLTRNLLLVEQPVHRDHALDPGIRMQLEEWANHPPIIIDEADGDLDSLPTALSLGYSGTSHKNCKGIIKGLLNAALLHHHSRSTGNQTILSGEDLANVGPVALLQDLAMMNCFGIPHVERNGHHYFKGLSALPETIQKATLDAHPDLYIKSDQNWPTLDIRDGIIMTQSLNEAPFGVKPWIDAAQFTPLDTWESSQL